jgi:DNA topoisomerase-1
VRDDHATDAREEEKTLPALAEGEALKVVDPPGVATEQKFTQPLARYNEGTLVKALEDLGIGRPSTYAEIVSKVLSPRLRGEARAAARADQARHGQDARAHRARFPDVVDYEFTAKIERDLDEVEAGNADWVKLVDRIYKPFKKLVDEELGQGAGRGLAALAAQRPHLRQVRLADGAPLGAQQRLLRVHRVPQVQEHRRREPRPPPEVYKAAQVPEVRRDLLVKTRAAPTSSFSRARGGEEGAALRLHRADALGHRVPEVRRRAGEGRRDAKGRKPFWGCENYAEGDAKCDFRLYTAPIKEPCPKCGAAFLVHGGTKSEKTIKCIREGCDYSRPADEDAAAADAAD